MQKSHLQEGRYSVLGFRLGMNLNTATRKGYLQNQIPDLLSCIPRSLKRITKSTHFPFLYIGAEPVGAAGVWGAPWQAPRAQSGWDRHCLEEPESKIVS